METNAKNWLESRLVENDGCQGNIDATIRLAKLWKSLQEEIPPLLEKTPTRSVRSARKNDSGLSGKARWSVG
jgi:hypothetical protein